MDLTTNMSYFILLYKTSGCFSETRSGALAGIWFGGQTENATVFIGAGVLFLPFFVFLPKKPCDRIYRLTASIIIVPEMMKPFPARQIP
jgi:hypothetical protein